VGQLAAIDAGLAHQVLASGSASPPTSTGTPAASSVTLIVRRSCMVVMEELVDLARNHVEIRVPSLRCANV
jgi:hypothetical protein